MKQASILATGATTVDGAMVGAMVGVAMVIMDGGPKAGHPKAGHPKAGHPKAGHPKTAGHPKAIAANSKAIAVNIGTISHGLNAIIRKKMAAAAAV